MAIQGHVPGILKKKLSLFKFANLKMLCFVEQGKSLLVNMTWLRVVLDEGHVIRNPNAMMSKAVHELKCERRWVVTGTPIQNSMKDLFSIISFLKLEPFTDRQWWRRTMERPISDGDEAALW